MEPVISSRKNAVWTHAKECRCSVLAPFISNGFHRFREHCCCPRCFLCVEWCACFAVGFVYFILFYFSWFLLRFVCVLSLDKSYCRLLCLPRVCVCVCVGLCCSRCGLRTLFAGVGLTTRSRTRSPISLLSSSWRETPGARSVLCFFVIHD